MLLQKILLLVIIMLGIGASAKSQGNKVTDHSLLNISGRFVNISQTDNIELYLWKEIINKGKRYHEPYRKIESKIQGGKFSLQISGVRPGMYITLSNAKHDGLPIPIIDLYRISPTDSIYIEIYSERDKYYNSTFSDSGEPKYNYSVKFSGLGYSKYQYRYEIDSLYQVYSKEFALLFKNRGALALSTPILRMQYAFDFTSYITKKQVAYLESKPGAISDKTLQLIKTDLIAANLYSQLFSHISIENILRSTATANDSLKALYQTSDLLKLFNETPYDLGASSAAYLATSVRKAMIENALFSPHKTTFNMIQQIRMPLLRDKLLTAYLIDQNGAIPDSQFKDLWNAATDIIKTPSCLSLLKNLNKTTIGSPLNDFELPDKNGKMIKLTDFKGKVVFLDFFYTGCGNCISYFKNTISLAEELYNPNPDVIFMTISIDGSRDRWLKSLESKKYTTDRAINLYTMGKGADHPIIKSLNISGYPHPILIDRKGNIFSNAYKDLGQDDPQKLIETIKRALGDN